jgi:hypothetical protein
MADDPADALIIEGIVATNGNGIDAIVVITQLERARSYALGLNDALEKLLGRKPTTAEMRAEWKELKRRTGG